MSVDFDLKEMITFMSFSSSSTASQSHKTFFQFKSVFAVVNQNKVLFKAHIKGISGSTLQLNKFVLFFSGITICLTQIYTSLMFAATYQG